MWTSEKIFSKKFLKKIDEILKDAQERCKAIASAPKREEIDCYHEIQSKEDKMPCGIDDD